MRDPKPIPIPAAQRWREIRIRFIPLLMFLGAMVTATLIWKQQVPVDTILGEVEPITANVSSPKSGVLANLTTRLQGSRRAIRSRRLLRPIHGFSNRPGRYSGGDPAHAVNLEPTGRTALRPEL
jgi:hypothetical protein